MSSTLNYVDKWFKVERFPTDVSWISLKSKEVRWNEVMSLAEQIAPELDDNQLFDEVSTLNNILTKIPDPNFDELTAEKKWMQIFKADLPNLNILVSKIFSIPVSNAPVERVFSLCSAQWTVKCTICSFQSPNCLNRL